MRDIIKILILCFGFFKLNAQDFQTTYSKSYISSFCGEEKFEFSFYNNFSTRTDSYYNTSVKSPSRREHTDFDKSGFYYEICTPTFYLESFGIDEYRKVRQFNYKICFDKKGGRLLYIFESDANLDIESGKFYFTDEGYKIFCDN